MVKKLEAHSQKRVIQVEVEAFIEGEAGIEPDFSHKQKVCVINVFVYFEGTSVWRIAGDIVDDGDFCDGRSDKGDMSSPLALARNGGGKM